jgi:hypothetical protein
MQRSKYQEACLKKSDINEHLPTLLEYASKCDHVTEFGVRKVVSTYALIEAKPKVLRCYDIDYHDNMKIAEAIAVEKGIDIKFIIQNVLDVAIDETDLLFIDTLHTYDQLKSELELHASKVRKYLAFHDVTTFGLSNKKFIDDKGLMPAILEFLEKNKYWRVCKYSYSNNGLLILEKQ